jgi:hypothetical protein
MSPRKARRLPGELPNRRRAAARGALRVAGPGAARAAGRTAAAANGLEARLGPPVTEEWPDGDWVIRQVPNGAAVKLYRCPGCNQEIRPGTAHLVVWPARSDGTEYRRHWHNACWRRRPRRMPPGYR